MASGTVYTDDMHASELSAAVKAQAHQLGFSDCRIVPIGDAPHAAFFESWLAAGRAGEMQYLARNVAKRRSPALLAEPGQAPFASMIVLGVDYHQYDLPAEIRDDPSRGIIASYAWGDDYHELIRPLLYELDAYIRSVSGRTTLGKCLVDTGPVLERDWAQAAGLGFTGKNCCTIVPGQGSWQLLAVVLVPEVLAPDLPLAAAAQQAPGRTRPPTCGQCTRCLHACPTGAFVAAYDLDPQRCISYWTIEAAGDIPLPLRPLFGNRIFGCDICQEVCPYNRRLGERTPLLAGLHAQAHRVAPPLLEGFAPETALLAGRSRLQRPLCALAAQTGETAWHAAQCLRGAGQLGRLRDGAGAGDSLVGSTSVTPAPRGLGLGPGPCPASQQRHRRTGRRGTGGHAGGRDG